jgi:hypothetical protein
MATESLFFLDPAESPVYARDPGVAHARDVVAAEKLLKTPGLRVRSVFVCADQPRSAVLEAIRLAHAHQPGAPILLFFDGYSEAVPTREQRFLGVHGAVSRPRTAA